MDWEATKGLFCLTPWWHKFMTTRSWQSSDTNSGIGSWVSKDRVSLAPWIAKRYPHTVFYHLANLKVIPFPTLLWLNCTLAPLSTSFPRFMAHVISSLPMVLMIWTDPCQLLLHYSFSCKRFGLPWTSSYLLSWPSSPEWMSSPPIASRLILEWARLLLRA